MARIPSVFPRLRIVRIVRREKSHIDVKVPVRDASGGVRCYTKIALSFGRVAEDSQTKWRFGGLKRFKRCIS